MQLSPTLEYPLLSISPESLLFNPKNQNSWKLPNFPPRYRLCTPTIACFPGFSVRCRVASGAMGSQSEYSTLVEFLGKAGIGVGDDLVLLFDHIQYACKSIASLVASPFNSSSGKQASLVGGWMVNQNEIILSSLRNSGKVAVMASEEDPVWIADDGPLVGVTDPLDGSKNIDASILTGSIFGIYNQLVELDHLPTDEKAQLNSLQRGTRLVASAYVLYSSAATLCATFGSGTHAFTLDRSTGDFILTLPNIKIPPRGKIYSVNDAGYFDWPESLRPFIDTVRQGKEDTPRSIFSTLYMLSGG